MSQGKLIVEIEKVTMNDKVGIESLIYREGSQYVLFQTPKSWYNAEIHCQEKGGHLASVRSQCRKLLESKKDRIPEQQCVARREKKHKAEQKVKIPEQQCVARWENFAQVEIF